MRKSPGLAHDCELAARIKEGDRGALRRLIDRHIGRVRMYLVHRLQDEGREGSVDNDKIIDTILAATFSDAQRLIGPYASGLATTPMEFWLITLAEKNIKRLGAEKMIERVAEEMPAPQERSDMARFRDALAAIPERFRPVLVLAVVEQMPAADIAHCLGLSPAGAMRRLRAALKSIGVALESQEVG